MIIMMEADEHEGENKVFSLQVPPRLNSESATMQVCVHESFPLSVWCICGL